MLFAPFYIAMTFIKTWRIRSFRARLLEFLSGNTSVAFCKVPENAAETPTLSSKLCTNPRNAYLCDLLDYTANTRICSMKPPQCIEISDWVTCAGGLPLGSTDASPDTNLDVEVLFECEMDPNVAICQQDVVTLESMGELVAWKAGSHLAIVLKTNIESLSDVGFNFSCGEFVIDHKLPVVRIQTVQISGIPNSATDPSMRSLRGEIQHALKLPPAEFKWPVHAALLRRLSKVVDIKSENKVEMNGTNESTPRKTVMLADVSVNTTKSLTDEDNDSDDKAVALHTDNSEPSDRTDESDKEVVVENLTVEIHHNITPRKSSLRLDLKKGANTITSSLINISSQIKSVTTHKKVVSTTGPKKHSEAESSQNKEESELSQSTSKSVKNSRPLVNTKSPNVLIYSDSVTARDNLESLLRKVLDSERYTIYSVTREALEMGAWRGRAALVAVAGCAGRGAPLLLAHLLDGGRLLALCSDLLHTVLPYYKTAEIRENEVVQFSFDRWKSVKMKHHIFCYQASPAKKQFSTESERQPSKYTGHPGHELDIRVLASEETWRTPSLLQATDNTNNGIAIFSQIHLEADPCDYLGAEGQQSNEARLEIIHKILGDILGLHVRQSNEIENVAYTEGYFLGNHVDKLSMIEGIYEDWGSAKVTGGDVTLQWLSRGEPAYEPPSRNFLPLHVYECPENFSTVEYYDHLSSRSLGRLVLYADVISSTMDVTKKPLTHGAACVARRQLCARGRGTNSWISPPGQACISIQIWQNITACLSLIQLASALAVVRAVRAQPGYESLDIRIKWPNDIYYKRETKLGGTLTTCECTGENVVIVVGTGVNISNTAPTICVNTIIEEYNREHNCSLPQMSVEKFLARYCSQMERILDQMADEGLPSFCKHYYEYWLHTDERIRVQSRKGLIEGTIVGVDIAGWLLVHTHKGELRVEPDGNTFDMMKGLVAPKL